MSDAETAYALALVFDLLPTAAQREHAGKRLSDLVRDCGYHIRTGFVGTPIVCDALCQTGHFLTAYRLLLQQENPSWLYPVTLGATTIWERWDSMLPDGSINPGEMTSFNHYAFGAVADWMHRTVGGLAPAAPGYRQIEIRPRPGGSLTHAKAQHITPYGLAESSWTIENGTFTLEVTVPANASALVTLPGSAAPLEMGSGLWRWSVPYQVPDARGPFTVDDVVGDILGNPAARMVILQALDRAEIPEYQRNMLFTERHLPLRQALSMFPDYAAVLKMTSDALASL
jgi:alpha-L-rhamnosidase